MDGVNSLTLIGNVGKDTEMSFFENDKKVARVVLATNETYKKLNGEKESRTEWHTIEFWGNTAQFCGDYVKKGMLLYVTGKVKTDKYEKDGITQYRTKVIGNDVKILSNGSYIAPDKVGADAHGAQNGAVSQAREQSQEYVKSATPQQASTVSSATFTNPVDDLPF